MQMVRQQVAIQVSLVTDNVDYVKPEQLVSYEIGYKGLFTQNFIVDLNVYYTSYSDFIGGDDVAAKFQTTHQGTTFAPGTIYSPYRNSTEDVTSTGIGLGLTYNFGKGYSITEIITMLLLIPNNPMAVPSVRALIPLKINSVSALEIES